MNSSIQTASKCFIAKINGKKCGFWAYFKFPHPKVKNLLKSHRVVVLPEFQGLGIGSIVTDELSYYFSNQGYRVMETTSHPARIAGYRKKDYWICKTMGRILKNKKAKIGGDSQNRMISSWLFLPKKYEKHIEEKNG